MTNEGQTLQIPAPPVPNNTVVDTVADEELVAGQEGVILVPFHSNPPPNNITWYLTDLDQPLYLNQTYGKYTSEGWMEYVGLGMITYGIFHYFSYSEQDSYKNKDKYSNWLCCSPKS